MTRFLDVASRVFWCSFYITSPEHKVLIMSFVTGLCPSSCIVCPSSTFSFNIFSPETAYLILTKLHKNYHWGVPFQSGYNGSGCLHTVTGSKLCLKWCMFLCICLGSLLIQGLSCILANEIRCKRKCILIHVVEFKNKPCN